MQPTRGRSKSDGLPDRAGDAGTAATETDGREFARVREDLQRPHVHDAVDFGRRMGRADRSAVCEPRPLARIPRPALRPDHIRGPQGLPEPRAAGDGEPVPRRGQRGPLQLLGRAPRSAGDRPGPLRRRHRSAPRARSRVDPPVARDLALRPPDDDRDRALHRPQVHPRGPVLHHHRSGRSLLPGGLQPGEDSRLPSSIRGPVRAGSARPRRARTTRRA